MSISNIPEPVRYLLWAKSAGRCEFDGCNEPLYRDGLTQIDINFGEVAHIIGDRPTGPRGHAVLSQAYCNNVNNLMLMCPKHHKMIDTILVTYTDGVLRQMKREHEERMETLTAITPDKTSQVLIFTGRVGEIHPKIDDREAWQAMFPEWYPSSHLPIVLGLSNSSFADNEPDFWRFESTNLERQFVAKVQPALTSPGVRNHFSVFGFAPQPLLIKLGSLLSDLYPAEIYQLHREPATWKWQLGPDNFEYVLSEPTTNFPVVALNLSLSATIDHRRIESVFSGQPYSEWQLTIANPNNDFLKSRGQLQLFREKFRTLLNAIKAKHGEKAVIHVFPAVPVAIAVEIGRIRQSKADLPLVIYDQNRKTGGFMQALTIGDVKNG